jgi:hypothetical protein
MQALAEIEPCRRVGVVVEQIDGFIERAAQVLAESGDSLTGGNACFSPCAVLRRLGEHDLARGTNQLEPVVPAARECPQGAAAAVCVLDEAGCFGGVASTTAARSDSDRHARRVRELIAQQQKLLHLYYDDGVSKEVLQAEQARIATEQAAAKRLAAAAKFEVSDIAQALDDALALIDERRAPYTGGSSTERRLINLAIYEMLLVSITGEIEARPTALYDQLVPLARKLAREQGRTGARNRCSRPQNGRDPVFRGHGLKDQQMAEREGFEPSNEVSPVTRFPVAPVQPLRHLSRRL